jgi:hypothetical protein
LVARTGVEPVIFRCLMIPWLQVNTLRRNNLKEFVVSFLMANNEVRLKAGLNQCQTCNHLLASGVDEGLVLKIGGWKTRAMLDRYNVTDIRRLSAAMEKGGKFVTDRIAVANASR